jgi:hypothetical protein
MDDLEQIAVADRGTDPANMAQLWRMANMLLNSQWNTVGPDGPKFKNAADVYGAIDYGAAFGLRPTQAMQAVHSIRGKPGIGIWTMLAIVQKSPNFCHVSFAKQEVGTPGKDDWGFAYTMRRNIEGAKPWTEVFTVKDAKSAGLWAATSGKGAAMPWAKFPKDMLAKMAAIRVMRNLFSDDLSGLVTTEERQIADIMDQIDLSGDTNVAVPDRGAGELPSTPTTGALSEPVAPAPAPRSSADALADALESQESPNNPQIIHDIPPQAPDDEAPSDGAADAPVPDMQGQLTMPGLEPRCEVCEQLQTECNCGKYRDPEDF